jgi:hypothetical protein
LFHMTKLGTIDLSSTPAEKCYFGSLAVFKLDCNALGVKLYTNKKGNTKHFGTAHRKEGKAYFIDK